MQATMLREHIDEIDFFRSMDDKDKEFLSTIAHVRTYSKGQILFYENDNVPHIYFLLSGEIKFYKVDRFENEIFLYILNAPSFLYDVSKFIISESIHCFSNAEFSDDSTVLEIDTKKFKEHFFTKPKCMERLLHESFKAIAGLQCIINRDIVFDATSKVAHFLVNELDKYNNLKKQDIAYMLHIQPETLSRIVKKFVRNESIEVQKNVVCIKNIEKLKSIYQ